MNAWEVGLEVIKAAQPQSKIIIDPHYRSRFFPVPSIRRFGDIFSAWLQFGVCFYSVSTILNHLKVAPVNLSAHCLSGFTKAPFQLLCYQQNELMKSEIKGFSLYVCLSVCVRACVCVRSVSHDKLLLPPVKRFCSFPFQTPATVRVERQNLNLYLRSGTHQHIFCSDYIK